MREFPPTIQSPKENTINSHLQNVRTEIRQKIEEKSRASLINNINLIYASKSIDNINININTKSNMVSPKRNKINVFESFQSPPIKTNNQSSNLNLKLNLNSNASTAKYISNSPKNALLKTKSAIESLFCQPSNLIKGGDETINYRSTIKNEKSPTKTHSDYVITQRAPYVSTNERKRNLDSNNIFPEMLTKVRIDNNKILSSPPSIQYIIKICLYFQ